MPPPRILFYFLLDELYQDFITRLGLNIGLSIVWRWIEYLNLIRFGKIMHLLWNKWWDLIHCQSLRNAESMNNMFCNKLNHLFMCHILQRNRFSPFSEVIYSNNMNWCPFEEGGLISPIKSNPHPRNGHGLIIGCNNAVGTNCISPNRWCSSHPLYYLKQSDIILVQ